MRQTQYLQKAVLSDLFKKIKLTTASTASSQSTSHTTSPDTKHLNQNHSNQLTRGKWESSFDKLTESLYGPLPMTEVEARNLAGSLNNYLISNLEKRSKKASGTVADHFMDLFTNLNSISGTPEPTLHTSHAIPRGSTTTTADAPVKSILSIPFSHRVSLISKCKSNDDLEAYFQELYFSGKLNKHLLIALLNNKSFTSLDLVSRLIFNGVQTRNLPVPTLHYARMIIANRNWALGNKDAAKSMIIDSWGSVWCPALKSNTLQSNVVQGLIKALIAFNQLGLLSKTLEDWRGDLHAISNKDNVTDNLQDVSSSVLLVLNTLLQTKHYQLAQLCSEIGVIYYSILVTRNQGSVSKNITNARELSLTYFKCLFSILSFPRQTLSSATVSKPLSSLMESIQKIQVLFSNSNELGQSFDVEELSESLRNSAIIFADIAASTLRNVTSGLEASAENEVEKGLIANQLKTIVDLIKPVLNSKFSSSRKLAEAGPKESISVAIALQKVKTIENYLSQGKDGGNDGGSAKRHNFGHVPSEQLVWN